MAFAFIVEDGTGLAAANAYASREHVAEYADIDPHHGPLWLALGDEQQERGIVYATRFLDDRVDWSGKRVFPESGTRWPRSGVFDRDGNAIAPTIIPRQLRDAVAAFAMFLVVDDATRDSASNILQRVKADVVEVEFKAGTYGLARTIPTHLEALLQGLGDLRINSQFSKIKRV